METVMLTVVLVLAILGGGVAVFMLAVDRDGGHSDL